MRGRGLHRRARRAVGAGGARRGGRRPCDAVRRPAAAPGARAARRRPQRDPGSGRPHALLFEAAHRLRCMARAVRQAALASPPPRRLIALDLARWAPCDAARAAGAAREARGVRADAAARAGARSCSRSRPRPRSARRARPFDGRLAIAGAGGLASIRRAARWAGLRNAPSSRRARATATRSRPSSSTRAAPRHLRRVARPAAALPSAEAGARDAVGDATEHVVGAAGGAAARDSTSTFARAPRRPRRSRRTPRASARSRGCGGRARRRVARARGGVPASFFAPSADASAEDAAAWRSESARARRDDESAAAGGFRVGARDAPRFPPRRGGGARASVSCS